MKVALTIMRAPGDSQEWPRGLKTAAHRAYREAEAIMIRYPHLPHGTVVVEVRKKRDK